MDQDKQTLEFLGLFVRYQEVYAHAGETMQGKTLLKFDYADIYNTM